MSDKPTGAEEPKLRVLIDRLHGERNVLYDKLVNILTEYCRVTILEKKPLDSKLLTENDVFMIISPDKPWQESEIEAVRSYVESDGGILLAMTLDGRKPERLNELLEPYGLSVIPGTVGEEYLHWYDLQGSQLLEGIKSLAAGRDGGWESSRIAASDEGEIITQFKDAALAAKRSLGKGTAFLFSCLPVFGNKQLDKADNRRFLDNLLKSLATPTMTGALQFIAGDKAVLKVLIDKLHGEEHILYDKLVNILTEYCRVTILEKKPLDSKLLTENDVFMIISPDKPWQESEIEAVRSYVESDGGILLAVTRNGRKPERLNELLEPYGLSVIPGTVGKEYLHWYDLQGSQLLEGIKSLAAGRVWGYESGRITASDEGEIITQFKDAVLAAKRSLGKGTAFLFSCLPVFGNKQLDKADNRRFLDNLLGSLATPEMTGALQFIADDKAVAAKEIIGPIQVMESTLLFFTANSVIVAKLSGSSLAQLGGAALGGIIGAGIADAVAKGRHGARLTSLSPDEILTENKGNFAIPYEKIEKFELCQGEKSGSFRGFRINTVSTEHEFQSSGGNEFEEHLGSLVHLVLPVLSEKLSIQD